MKSGGARFEFVKKLQEFDRMLMDQTRLFYLSSSPNAADRMRARKPGIACYYETP